MLPHLWKEAVMSKSLVLLRQSAQNSIHVLVAQAVPGVIVDKVHARELASVLNAAMALHENNAEERSNAGCFHNKIQCKMDPPQHVSLQHEIGAPFS